MTTHAAAPAAPVPDVLHVVPRAASESLATVTVVVPCYNYADYLPHAVHTALSQQEVDVEVVIVDDASTDNSLEVARQLAAADARVRVLAHPENRGPVRTFNDGLATVVTEFVVRLDADDLLTPGSLARSAQVCAAFPSVGLVYGHPIHFDEEPPPARGRRKVGSSGTVLGGSRTGAGRGSTSSRHPRPSCGGRSSTRSAASTSSPTPTTWRCGSGSPRSATSPTCRARTRHGTASTPGACPTAPRRGRPHHPRGAPGRLPGALRRARDTGLGGAEPLLSIAPHKLRLAAEALPTAPATSTTAGAPPRHVPGGPARRLRP